VSGGGKLLALILAFVRSSLVAVPILQEGELFIAAFFSGVKYAPGPGFIREDWLIDLSAKKIKDK